jgi:class 3 adenylate cyclase
MSNESSRLAAEMVHVLFMDLVGYSLLPIEEQTQLRRELLALVRATPEVLRGEQRGDLLRRDLGDGMALVFARDPIAPAHCAVEIARALRQRPHLRLRMGIHSGPVVREGEGVAENVAGGGINLAQRVMDCGDAGHILLSHSSAEVLGQFTAWGEALHDLGTCEVKHGVRLRLFNLATPEYGNLEPPQRLKSLPVQTLNSPDPLADATALLEPVGGAVPLDSRFYIQRPVDAEFHAAMARQDSIVLVKGARQIGKTSLLARGLQQARDGGARVVLTDFQKLSADHLKTSETLFFALAQLLADQLDTDVSPRQVWSEDRAPGANFERFLRREVLNKLAAPVVWGLDEVDRLFTCPFGSDVFALFRSWHNERSLDPSGPWRRLTLAITYATEAYLFITDLNQSPFNVGTRLALSDFTLAQVAELNARYGSPLRDASEVGRFYALLSGHPYLVRRGLHEMATHRITIEALEGQAEHDEGLFGDHLRRILALLARDADLCEVVRNVLRGKGGASDESFYRLRSAGVMAGDTPTDIHPRCRLYTLYLTKRLQ